ncbi:MAG: DUF5606 domain-containing protein [Bacteroidales bacterium]|nr:DUF5606 domain-containing protein [Bacteroidales bacterium]MBQ7490810.1 DUF5606 domain-containing protein [Bacteroidales bacterium]
MDLSKVLSITGKGGLFKLVSKAKTSFIVESFADGKRFPAFSSDGVAILENISIFTNDGDVPLMKVFQSIYKKENGGKAPDILQDSEKLKAYFAEVLPDYDRDRVYVSNMKKVLSWYNILQENNLVDDKDEPAEEGEKKE